MDPVIAMNDFPLMELAVATAFLLAALSVWWFFKTRIFKKSIQTNIDDMTQASENGRKATRHIISSRQNRINKMALSQQKDREAKERRDRIYGEEILDDDYLDYLAVGLTSDDDDNPDKDYKKMVETKEKSNLKPERWEQQADYEWKQGREKMERTYELETPNRTATTPEPGIKISSTSNKSPSDYDPPSGGDDSGGSGGGSDD